MNVVKTRLSTIILTLVILSGCSHPQTVSDPAVVIVNWSTLPKSIQNVTYAIVSMYAGIVDTNSRDMVIKQTWTETDEKKMYLISLHGTFHIGGVTKTATNLSFSVLDDVSKVWGLVATDSRKTTVWQDSDFNVVRNELHFEGKSKDWKGIYSVSGVQVWSTDFKNFGSWQQDQFNLTYTGSDPKVVVPHLGYKLDTPVSSCSGSQDHVHLDQVFGCGGAGNGAVPQRDDTLKATVSWEGQTETFSLQETGK